MTHFDLFSGLGGFALAAREAGFKTIAFCENNERCRTFLERRWGLPVEPDIKTLDGGKYRRVTLLTGGPPCQAVSRAGKQRGEEDDRWLWGESLRVLAEAQPDCVVFENPPGILDVGIDGILSEMGRLGYETQCFDIPACAVDSPQLRRRIWIVGFMGDSKIGGFGIDGSAPGSGGHPEQSGENDLADASIQGHQERGMRSGISGGKGFTDQRKTTGMGNEGHVAESNCGGEQRTTRAETKLDREGPYGWLHHGGNASRLAGSERERRERGTATPGQTESGQPQPAVDGLRSYWSEFVWVPSADGKLRRAPACPQCMDHGVSGELSEGVACANKIEAHRSLLGALGNSIVPQVAVQILKAVKAAL